MALPDRQWLLLLVAMMAFCAGGASKDITGGYFQYDCPVSTGPSTTRGTAFDDNLRSLMAALPSAAAPTGFASLRAGRGRALATARGLCFGDSPPPESCRDCLSQSAGIVLDACDGNRSAAVWTDGCFLAYTDGNASASATDDDVIYVAASSSNNLSCDAEEVVPLARSLVPRAAHGSSARMLATAYTTCQANGGGDTVHALAQCPRDAAPADCALCLDKSARTLPDSLQWSRGIPVGASSLHRYNCTMRFERSRPAPPIGRGAGIPSATNDVFYGASPSSNDVSCDAEEIVRLARSLVTRVAHGSSGRMLVTADTACQANSNTVHALAQCPRDVAPANCALCLDKSARTLPDSLQRSQGIPVGASSLHRYNCTMRFERSPLAPPIGRGARIRKKLKDNMVVVIVGAVAIVAMISVAAFLLVKRKVNKAQAARQLNSEV